MKKIVIFSTGEFGKIFIEEISKKGIKPELVISKRENSPTWKSAKKIGIPITAASLEDSELLKKIEPLKEKLFVSIDYGEIIPYSFIKSVKEDPWNIHPSLLPKYRGPTPIQSVILNGEKTTGVTIHYMTSKLDSGDILLQEKLLIKNSDNFISLREKLAKLSASLFLKALELDQENKLNPKKQDEKKATYTQKFSLKEGQIKPCEETAQLIERKVKALNPEPGTFLIVKKREKDHLLKIFEIEILPKEKKGCGEFFEFKKQLALGTKTQPILIKKLQLSGKKITDSKSFLNGNKWIFENKLS